MRSTKTFSARQFFAIALFVFPARALHAQTVWHVDDDCTPPGAGTELDPLCTIQDGVNAAQDGDTVLVAAGTYTGDGNRDISLFGKTIALRSTEEPAATTIDIEGNPQSIHRGFFLIHGETSETVIEGFTIINGYLIGDTGGTGPGGGGGGGGGAFYIRDSSPTIRNCVIRDHISATLSPPFPVDGRGAGIYVDGNSNAIIENCIIADNLSERRGGGMYIGYNNSAVTIRNCLIYDNLGGGGAVYNTFASTVILNTSITYNESAVGFISENSDALLSNCIIWGNQLNESSTQIIISAPSVPTLEYSDIQGGLGGVEVCCGGEVNWGPGNIDADPLFFDPDSGDYHLLHGSPCIDAGNNLAVPEGVVADLDGGPRFLDDPNIPDTGNPDPDAPDLPIVDMGPYEFDHLDCNNNDTPDVEDLESGTSSDINEDGIPDECQLDCNDNGIPDVTDIADGVSTDCDDNNIPDECEVDCNGNDQTDACDIADGTSEDCNGNNVPDECEPAGPIITQHPMSQEVDPGDLAHFHVSADGVQLEYQWRKDGVDLSDTDRITGTNTAFLFILDVEPSDAGSYDCVVTDFFGCSVASDVAVLTVIDPCPADLDGNGTVSASDLAFLLGNWGLCPNPDACPADLNNDDIINAADLAILLGNWGPCP